MVTVTLDERDAAALERLRDGNADVGTLAETTGCDPEYLRERLPELADNGLVERVDDAYRITEDGERAMAGSPAGTMDDRIDTPDAVEERVESFDLRPDREEALRNAFSVLRYWGSASGPEIVDAAYSENPAGFDGPREWWEEGVRDRLADLPLVESPASTGEPWRYAGTPTVEETTEDGRVAPGVDPPAGASVRFALEQSELDDDERAAVRAAFAHLFEEGEASAASIRKAAYPDHGAGYDSAADWWADCVRDGLDSLPGVERVGDEGDGESVWRYRQVDEGGMATEPEAETPDGPSGPEAGRDG